MQNFKKIIITEKLHSTVLLYNSSSSLFCIPSVDMVSEGQDHFSQGLLFFFWQNSFLKSLLINF
ncbi:hypothetical protein LguiB_021283 [Lonicera macranthoides]